MDQSDSVASDEAVQLSYSILSARYQVAQSTVWGLVTASVAAEAGLWIGMLTVRQASLAFGLGFVMLGMVSLLATRYFELTGMLDRQLMDEYEDALQIPARLRLEHGARLEERISLVLPRLDPASQKRFRKRRISKHDDDPALWHRLDVVLTTLGQASLVWTAMIAMTAVAGGAASIALATNSVWLTAVAGLLIFLLLALPWLLASESGRVTRLRDRRRR